MDQAQEFAEDIRDQLDEWRELELENFRSEGKHYPKAVVKLGPLYEQGGAWSFKVHKADGTRFCVTIQEDPE